MLFRSTNTNVNNTNTNIDIDIDDKIPLIERIDRCLNNNLEKEYTQTDNNYIINNLFDNNNNYNHKKYDDEDDVFNYLIKNVKNEYIDNYVTNRL